MAESMLAFGLAIATLVGTGSVIGAYWQRVRCAHRVFETAHDRLVGSGRSLFQAGVTVIETREGIRASGRCGGANEEVRLRRLEPEEDESR